MKKSLISILVLVAASAAFADGSSGPQAVCSVHQGSTLLDSITLNLQDGSLNEGFEAIPIKNSNNLALTMMYDDHNPGYEVALTLISYPGASQAQPFSLVNVAAGTAVNSTTLANSYVRTAAGDLPENMQLEEPQSNIMISCNFSSGSSQN